MLGRLWLLASWLARWRRVKVWPADVRRHLYREQTRGMGLRMTERLRNTLRPGWLRLRAPEDEGGD